MGPMNLHSHKFIQDAGAAGPRTTVGITLHNLLSPLHLFPLGVQRF